MDQRVQHVVSFIDENYKRRLTLKEIAESVNLSPWWLCHMFKNDMGMSPVSFLRQVRMEKAKGLLVSSFLTVKEVMGAVGISDAAYFSRCFKSIYGVTPAKYRDEQDHDDQKKR